MTQLIELSYISEAGHLFNEEELAELLSEARAKNLSREVTGLLLYKEPLFMQVLEGPEEVVETLFEAIKKDPRHCYVSGLLKGTISERTFPDWQMGFFVPKVSEIRKIEGFSDFLESSWSPSR